MNALMWASTGLSVGALLPLLIEFIVKLWLERKADKAPPVDPDALAFWREVLGRQLPAPKTEVTRKAASGCGCPNCRFVLAVEHAKARGAIFPQVCWTEPRA